MLSLIRIARSPLIVPISILLVVTLTACSTRRPVRLDISSAESANPRLMASILKEGDRIRVCTLEGNYFVGKVIKVDETNLTMICFASSHEQSLHSGRKFVSRDPLVIPWDELTEIEYEDRSGTSSTLAGIAVGVAAGTLIFLYLIGQALGDISFGGQ